MDGFTGNRKLQSGMCVKEVRMAGEVKGDQIAGSGFCWENLTNAAGFRLSAEFHNADSTRKGLQITAIANGISDDFPVREVRRSPG